MRPKLQKHSTLKLVGRIILHKQGMTPRILLRYLFPKLALGYYTRDCINIFWSPQIIKLCLTSYGHMPIMRQKE